MTLNERIVQALRDANNGDAGLTDEQLADIVALLRVAQSQHRSQESSPVSASFEAHR